MIPRWLRLWLCCCCLAAWPAPGRPDTAAPLAENEELPPPPFSADFSQQHILPEGISPEFLSQIRQGSFEDEDGFPILIHGEPQSFQPRGKRPPCKKVGCTQKRLSYKLDDFPPGRPSLSNLGALCSAGRTKPNYGPWNLPQTSFSHLLRQGEALNELEAQFTHCCQLEEDQKLPCCTNVWETELIQFCKQEYSVKTRPFHCCREASHQDRLACFADQAPYPTYDGQTAYINLSQIITPLLVDLCHRPPGFSKERTSPALVQNITEACCKLQEDERILCAEEVKSQFIATFCSPQKRNWKDTQKCCAQTEEAARNECFNFNYLGHVSLIGSEQEAQQEDPLPTKITS